MTGGALQRNVLDLCRHLHLHTAHFRPGMFSPDPKTGERRWLTAVSGDGKGWPDLYVCGPGGMLWREIKGAREAVSAEQRQWLEWLREAGGDADVWRPADWPVRITAELQRLRRRP